MKTIFKPKLYTLLKNGISKEQVLSDIFAGIIVGIVALPLSIAFAVASGVSPERGIITAIVAGLVIAIFGGSRVQIGGPTGAFIIIVFGIVQEYGIDGLMMSTILAGIILIIFGFLKLGSLLKYFPHPLIVGFTSGIALVILSTQIKDALGLNIEHLPSSFIDKCILYFNNITSLNIYALITTLITIFIIICSKYLTKKIPGSFIAIILVTSVVVFFDIPINNIETFFGDIHSEISFAIPNLDFANITHYFAPALIIAILGGIESLLSAVVADGMIGGNHRSNTELIAQGMANIITPFFGGIPATGAIARTATNVKNGGRTPIAGITHAIVLFLIMMFFADLAKLIPMPCLAGILIVIAYNMSEWRSFVSIIKTSKFDAIVLLSTFLLTVLVDLTVAIEIGIVLSSLLFMKRMADINTNIQIEDDDIDTLEEYRNLPEEIGTYEIAGPLFFACAKSYTETIKSIANNNKILIIRMRYVPFIDSTGLNNLEETIKFLHDDGIVVILSGTIDSVYEDLRKKGIVTLLGNNNIFKLFPKALTQARIINETINETIKGADSTLTLNLQR
ncbi:sulfate anion transporter [Psychromonas sp. CNPT3]|uniref:SulP family inorganic anion transporter n=1 Tax=Psychromonas sp. CNPT3 TaxID=314282 RepID=UPI00006E76B5|nr:SulP family inorganic anion transporter [Psychromonas sp. CNPT3]AGH80621.1 sulfate anion transporter [Psychromonas sp. CNPT3]